MPAFPTMIRYLLLLLVLAPHSARGQQAVRMTVVGYPDHLVGRTTASGEVYNPNGLTAAHPSLPFGSMLELVSPRTGRSVMVSVNDRGSVSGGVSLVASAAAISRLGHSVEEPEAVMVRPWSTSAPPPAAVAAAATTPTRPPAPPRPSEPRSPEPATSPPSADGDGTFVVQLGSFSDRASAEALGSRVEGTRVVASPVDGRTVYRVLYGSFRDRGEAEAWRYRLESLGATGYVRQLR